MQKYVYMNYAHKNPQKTVPSYEPCVNTCIIIRYYCGVLSLVFELLGTLKILVSLGISSSHCPQSILNESESINSAESVRESMCTLGVLFTHTCANTALLAYDMRVCSVQSFYYVETKREPTENPFLHLDFSFCKKRKRETFMHVSVKIILGLFLQPCWYAKMFTSASCLMIPMKYTIVTFSLELWRMRENMIRIIFQKNSSNYAKRERECAVLLK